MAGEMLQLSSMQDVIEAVALARNVALQAYTLHGPVLRALESAARHGAHVRVQLEARPYEHGSRRLAEENARIADELRKAGVDARLEDRIHAKTISIDGTLYLDEKNWHDGDIVLRDDDAADAASIAMTKHDALAREGAMLARGGDGLMVESESFGSGNATYAALKALGLAGAAPRLLVSENDLRGNERERGALENLVRDGVRVNLCKDSAKLAVAGDSAWLGSANATYADGKWAMPDWGLCTGDAAIVDAVRKRLDLDWAASEKFKCRKA